MVLSRVVRPRAAVATLAVLATAAVFSGSGTASASNHSTGRSYLALGDSVVFGYITGDGFAYRRADNFIGYPQYVSDALRFDDVDAACPGEATAGFLSATGADNGCRPFKANFPLHHAYPGQTQMDFATSWLQAHHNTHLVTIGLGANDAFILERTCGGDATCIGNGLPATLGTIAANMNTILGNLRATGYTGVIEVVNYYSLDYGDAAGTGLTTLLNQAVSSSAQAHGAVVADAFTAFKTATSSASDPFASGNTCKAGLLNGNPNPATAPALPVCDVHPSQAGQQLLAQVVEQTYTDATHDDGSDG